MVTTNILRSTRMAVPPLIGCREYPARAGEHHEEAPTSPRTSTWVRWEMAGGSDSERSSLGAALRRHRAASGLTQEQVAERAA